MEEYSTGDAVDPLAVVAFGGFDRQAHFLAERAADEPTHAVRLPTGSLHNLSERRAVLALEQVQDRGLLATGAGNGQLLGTLGAFPLTCPSRLALGGALRLLMPLRGAVRLFTRSAAVQALNRFPDPG